MTLREQFNEEQKAKTENKLELFFLLSNEYYIPWLESKVNKTESIAILNPRKSEY